MQIQILESIIPPQLPPTPLGKSYPFGSIIEFKYQNKVKVVLVGIDDSVYESRKNTSPYPDTPLDQSLSSKSGGGDSIVWIQKEYLPLPLWVKWGNRRSQERRLDECVTEGIK